MTYATRVIRDSRHLRPWVRFVLCGAAVVTVCLMLPGGW